MEINYHIIEGNYENCYSNLFLNVKNDQDSRVLLDFMEMTKQKCIDNLEKHYRECEAQIKLKYRNELLNEQDGMTDEFQKELLYQKKINEVCSELNRILYEKLKTSLAFGSIIYSFSDFRLKQEKARHQNLQNQYEQLKKEIVFFSNICKQKDDFIFKLKGRINNQQQQLDFQINSPHKTSSKGEMYALNDPIQNEIQISFYNNSQSNIEIPVKKSQNGENTQENRIVNDNIDPNPEQIKFENVKVYTYSFGKSTHIKNSLNIIEDNQNPSKKHSEESLAFNEEFNDNKELELHQNQPKQQSIQKSNVQILRNSLNCPPLDENNRISFFNGCYDQLLQKKQSFTPYQKNQQKNILCSSPIASQIKDDNCYILTNKNYAGTDSYPIPDPQFFSQIMAETSNLQQQQLNPTFYQINNSSYFLQENNQSQYEGCSPKSFIIHQFGNIQKPQIMC